MSALQEKLKNRRTRPAEIMGEEVQVKVYSGSEWQKLIRKIDKFSNRKMAEFISAQILDEAGNPLVTPEFILSDECPLCAVSEMLKLIRDINDGSYFLKN